MKFKAEITLEGMNALEKQFLPTMEKFGKTCYLFLTPTDVHLIQDQDNADGTQTSARLDNVRQKDARSAGANVLVLSQSLRAALNKKRKPPRSLMHFQRTKTTHPLDALDLQGYVFDTTSLVCQSLADNHIAFTITIATLLKVLRVARGHGAGSLRVKLTTRRAPSTNPEDGDSSVLCPMLVLFPQVEGLDISQEMPVGKPVGHDLLLRLRDLRSVGTICTFYLDIYPVLVHLTVSARVFSRTNSYGLTCFASCNNASLNYAWPIAKLINDKKKNHLSFRTLLQAIADRLKPLSETVSFSLTRQGDLHLNVEGTGVLLGEGVPGLEVLPHEEAEKAMELQ
jgi:hypothetical protein